MTSATFRKQQEELDARFAKQANALYTGSVIGLILITLLYLLELAK